MRRGEWQANTGVDNVHGAGQPKGKSLLGTQKAVLPNRQALFVPNIVLRVCCIAQSANACTCLEKTPVSHLAYRKTCLPTGSPNLCCGDGSAKR